MSYFKAAVCSLCIVYNKIQLDYFYCNSSTLSSMCKTKLCQTYSLEVITVSKVSQTLFTKYRVGYVFFRKCLWSLTSSLWPFQSHFCQTCSPGWPVWSLPLWSSQMDLRDSHSIVLRSLNFYFWQLKLFLLKRLSIGVHEYGWLEHWKQVGNDHQWRTTLHHRFFDWLSSDQHKVRGFRTLRRERDAKYSSKKTKQKKNTPKLTKDMKYLLHH